jgi:hypothetical protein
MKTSVFVPFLIVLASTSIETRPSLSFWKPVDSTVGDRAVTDAALADLNRDGRLDAAICAGSTGMIQVLFGDGNGGFALNATYAVAPGPGDAILTDVNGDAVADLVVGSSGIAVLLGHADGTFGSPIYTSGSGAWMVAADFDRDGRVDIASVGKNFPSSGIPKTVDVYRGNGDGSFSAPQYMFVSDNGPREIAAADLNGDGWSDLIIGESNARALHVYLNQGGLTFTRTATMFIEVGPAATATADMDGNGTVDIVTADFSGSVSVFLGHGDGTLQNARVFPVGAGCSGVECGSPSELAVADVDLDGRSDAVVALDTPGAVAILLNTGNGGLAAPSTIGTNGHATFAAAVDVDDDGGVDVATIRSSAAFGEAGSRLLSVYRNKLRAKVQKR